MKLATFIESVGDKEAARLFRVTTRAVASWRRGERIPKREHAQVIVIATDGQVSFDDIYGAALLKSA
jgi:DNA-binding transcriptional regulator YdaS (Cro superfamily)